MKIAGIIQARLGSTRLPNKVLLQVQNKSMLEHIIERLGKAKSLDCIAVATTRNDGDKKIIEVAHQCGIFGFAGDENNVLGRYIEAATRIRADVVVRICADNPLIDYNIIDSLVCSFIKEEVDYCASICSDGTPAILTGLGVSAEVVSLNALKRSRDLATENRHFEHVTTFIYEHPELFWIKYVKLGEDLSDKRIRLTVDTIDDFNVIQEIYDNLYKDGEVIPIKEVMNFLHQNEHILEIMEKSNVAHLKLYI